MSASSEESLKKDDNGGKSDSEGDIFVKIRSLFGDAICGHEALQSTFSLSLIIRRACTPEDFKLKDFKHFTVHFKLFLGHL